MLGGFPSIPRPEVFIATTRARQLGKKSIALLREANYGWAHWEGGMTGPKWRPGMSKIDYKSPLIKYGRELGNGIAGGLLYRGDAIPSLNGSYVFFDFWNDFLGRFYPDGNTA